MKFTFELETDETPTPEVAERKAQGNKVKVSMKLVRETKNTCRYDAANELPPVDALYVQKRDLQAEFGHDPGEITLTIEEVAK